MKKRLTWWIEELGDKIEITLVVVCLAIFEILFWAFTGKSLFNLDETNYQEKKAGFLDSAIPLLEFGYEQFVTVAMCLLYGFCDLCSAAFELWGEYCQNQALKEWVVNASVALRRFASGEMTNYRGFPTMTSNVK